MPNIFNVFAVLLSIPVVAAYLFFQFGKLHKYFFMRERIFPHLHKNPYYTFAVVSPPAQLTRSLTYRGTRRHTLLNYQHRIFC
jgi:hypothetical protein